MESRIGVGRRGSERDAGAGDWEQRVIPMQRKTHLQGRLAEPQILGGCRVQVTEPPMSGLGGA